MKKFLVCTVIIAAIAGLALGFGKRETAGGAEAYLRVHIRANSNSQEDQEVKYRVRDAVVTFLTPEISGCETKEDAMALIGRELPEIERVAERVLAEHGFCYGARASLKREEFPTRVYERATLAAGVYDALILELGTGTGDNWWCVVYPPLCFSEGNGNIVYRSKIAEIIRSFYE